MIGRSADPELSVVGGRGEAPKKDVMVSAGERRNPPDQMPVDAADPARSPAPFAVHDPTLPPGPFSPRQGGGQLFGRQRLRGAGQQERHQDRRQDGQQCQVDAGQVTQVAQQRADRRGRKYTPGWIQPTRVPLRAWGRRRRRTFPSGRPGLPRRPTVRHRRRPARRSRPAQTGSRPAAAAAMLARRTTTRP